MMVFDVGGSSAAGGASAVGEDRQPISPISCLPRVECRPESVNFYANMIGSSSTASATVAGAAATRNQSVADPTRDQGVADALVVTGIDPPVGQPAQTLVRLTD